MPISSTTNRVTYNGDGSSASFSFQYEFHAQSDLDVYIWNSSRLAATVNQVLNTNYTIAGTKDAQNRYTNGGTIVFNSTPATGDIISIVRDPDPTNPFSLLFNQQIPTAELTKALDRQAIVEQRLKDYATRSVHLADSFPLTFDPTLPDRLPAGAALIVGSNGTSIQVGVVTVAGTTAATFFGILPVPNGGTGLDFSLLKGIIYSPGNNTTFSTVVDTAAGNVLIANASSAPTFQALAATIVSSGVLAAQYGGTGTGQNFNQYQIMVASSTTQMSQIPSAGANTVLMANASSAPTFQVLSVAIINSGVLAVSQGGTGNPGPLTPFGLVTASSATQVSQLTLGGTDQPLIGVTGAQPSFAPLNIASNSSVTGIMAQSHGGTGSASSWPLSGIIYQQSASALGFVPSAASGLFLQSNGSSAPAFAAVTVTPVAATAVSAAYQALNTDTVIKANSSNYTITLFDANANVGRVLEVIRQTDFIGVSGSSVYPITIIGSSFSTTVDTAMEALKLQAKAGGWDVLRRSANRPFTTFVVNSGTIQGFGVPNVNSSTYKWARSDNTLLLNVDLGTGTNTANEARFPLPLGLVTTSSIMTIEVVGHGADQASASGGIAVMAQQSKNYIVFGEASVSGGAWNAPSTGSGMIANNKHMGFFATIQIDQWSHPTG